MPREPYQSHLHRALSSIMAQVLKRSFIVILLGFAALAFTAPTASPIDYVIVGAGPAGFVLAEYLTRNAAVRVTLLEAGFNEDSDPDIYSMFKPV